MVPGQLSLSEREQNQRADCGLQKETPAALHSSYDQWDPCGESKQLQVPRRKHLRGPDLDYTHPNTGQESQAKTVPSATAEKIQGLTNNPENFLAGTIESVLSQCISVWYGNSSSQDCKALQRVVRLAERISGSALPSCRTSTSNDAEAELTKSSKTQITLVTVFSLGCHLVSASAAWWQKQRDSGGVSSHGHQAPELKVSLLKTSSDLLQSLITHSLLLSTTS